MAHRLPGTLTRPGAKLSFAGRERCGVAVCVLMWARPVRGAELLGDRGRTARGAAAEKRWKRAVHAFLLHHRPEPHRFK